MARRQKTGGRVKGTPNKTTVAVKQAVLAAFNNVGGTDYLEAVARDDHKTFCMLLAKILPQEVKAEVQSESVIQTIDLTKLTDAELDALEPVIAALAAAQASEADHR